MTIAFTLGRVSRLSDRQSTAISLELGLHNGTLTIAVAATIDDRLAVPAAVYSLFMFLTAVPFALYLGRRNSRGLPLAGDGLPAPATAE